MQRGRKPREYETGRKRKKKDNMREVVNSKCYIFFSKSWRKPNEWSIQRRFKNKSCRKGKSSTLIKCRCVRIQQYRVGIFHPRGICLYSYDSHNPTVVTEMDKKELKLAWKCSKVEKQMLLHTDRDTECWTKAGT